MKSFLFSLILFTFNSIPSFSQTASITDIKVKVEFVKDNDLNALLAFKRISFHKIKFSGNDLKGKKYLISFKEIENGKKITDSVLFDSGKMPYESLQKINDTLLNISVISEKNQDKKAKISLNMGNFAISEEFNILERDDYSMRPIYDDLKNKIKLSEPFYLLTYFLPYKIGNTSGYCTVADSGKDIEKWGELFNIPHYLIFEMKFY